MKAPLHIANCQFLCKKVHNCISTLSPVCELRNCLFICDVYAHTVISDLEIGRRIVIDNCLQAGGEFTLSYGSLPLDDVWAATLIKVTRTTCLPKTRALAFHLVGREGKDEGRRVKVLGVEASRNVFDAESILAFAQLQPGKLLPVHDAEALLTQLVNWQGRGNLFALNGHLLVLGTREKQLDPAKPIKSIGDWKEFWRSAEAESIEGRVRYVGGDLRSKLRDAPEKLTPNDFRLRPDSAGYRAGKDGKDLGADVDLVGPGPAYERWQKTLAYQKWLKDSGQMKE